MQQLDHHRQAVVEAHCILGHLGVLVTGGQVTQSADGRLRDVFPVAGSQDGAHQGLDAPHLAEEEETHREQRLPEYDTVPLACAHTRQSPLGPSTVASCTYRLCIRACARVGSLASVPWPETTSPQWTETTSPQWTETNSPQWTETT